MASPRPWLKERDMAKPAARQVAAAVTCNHVGAAYPRSFTLCAVQAAATAADLMRMILQAIGDNNRDILPLLELE